MIAEDGTRAPGSGREEGKARAYPGLHGNYLNESGAMPLPFSASHMLVDAVSTMSSSPVVLDNLSASPRP